MFTENDFPIIFTPSELRILDVLKSKGTCSIMDISKISGQHRTNIYSAIQRLVALNIVYQVRLQKRRLHGPAYRPYRVPSVYRLADNSTLEKFFESEKQKLDKVCLELKNNNPSKENIEEDRFVTIMNYLDRFPLVKKGVLDVLEKNER